MALKTVSNAPISITTLPCGESNKNKMSKSSTNHQTAANKLKSTRISSTKEQ
jgi:hypothetical protein